MGEPRELPPEILARIEEEARWHRCYHCYCAPCVCPAGEGLGQQLATGAPLEAAKARRLKHDAEQVMPGSFKADPKKRGARKGAR